MDRDLDNELHIVGELLALRKLYEKYELDRSEDFEGNPIATWSGYKWFRNPISDRIEEITGVRSDNEVAEWIQSKVSVQANSKPAES